jgi:hypothetical protein
VRREQAGLGHPGFGAAPAQQRPYADHVQVQSFQEQHREEQPGLAAGKPGAQTAPGAGLIRGERDRPAGHVGITAHLVGVGVVAVVLGDPPAVAEPDQQVAVDPADQVVGTPRAGDLAVADVVPDEPGLGEHDPEKDGDKQLPPGPAERSEHGPSADEQQQVRRDLDAVIGRPPSQQADPLAGPGQLRVVASGRVT